MEKYDLIIVGAGPAGIFTAVELLRHGSKKHILLVEKGKPVEKRHCPKAELGHATHLRFLRCDGQGEQCTFAARTPSSVIIV